MIIFSKRYRYQVALCTSCFPLIYSPIAYTAETPRLMTIEAASVRSEARKETYTVNFNDISLVEFIRFASKITGLNFIFEEADLEFTVTVVSEDAVSSKAVMSALVQILRVHDLVIVEQDGNVLITKSRSVNQIPTIVSADLPNSKEGNSVLVTRVFRIKNTNVTSIADIIRPMISAGALIEVSQETKQLIVTDVTTSIDQIALLLLSIDMPHSNLEVETYVVKNIAPHDLISLTEQILKPFTEGNPLIFVPQVDTNSIFIVTTPHLIERAIVIMEDLDLPTKQMVVAKQGMTGKNIFLYKALHRSALQLRKDLVQISNQMKNAGGPTTPLQTAIDSVTQGQDSNYLIFMADGETTSKIQALLASIDTSLSNDTSLIYKPQYISADQIQVALQALIPSFKKINTLDNQNLVQAIIDLQWHPTIQAFLVSTDTQTIERLKTLLATIDTPPQTIAKISQGFFLYKLQSASCDRVLEEIKNVTDRLSPANLQNQNLINTVGKIECVTSTNSLLITGTSEAIEQIKDLIFEFDVSSGSVKTGSAFLMYKAKFLPAIDIQTALKDLSADLHAAGLEDPQLLKTLSTMRYVSASNSILFTGDPEILDKVQTILNGIDTSSALGAIQNVGNITFLLYKIQSSSADKLITALNAFAENLKQSTPQDKELANTIHSMKWIKETNTFLFTGSNDTLLRLEQVIKNFDITTLQTSPTTERAAASFVIYNPNHITGPDLILILHDFMSNLMNSGISDPGLFDSINNLKWIEKTSSLLISGDGASVEKVQQLLIKFDLPDKENATTSIESIDNTSFLVYKLQYHSGSDIQVALKQVAMSLGKTATTSTGLLDSINSLQWIQVTNSLLCTGPQDVLIKLKDLITSLDVPLRQVFIEVLVINTTLNNSQDFGLQWGSQAQYFNKAALGTGNFPNPSSPGQVAAPTFRPNLSGMNATTTPVGGGVNPSVPFATGFDLGVIGDIVMHKGKSFLSLGALVNALQTDTDSTILLNPKLITQDNRQSTIFVGQNVPYTGALVTNSAASSIQTSNIEYRDVGVSLTITPILGDDNIVTIDIVNDISQVINAASATNSADLTGVTTSHTHMETRVHVPNNHFIALSGMISESKTRYKTGIPCLGGLPVLGIFFSETQRSASKDNIIIFVRPQIVTSYKEYKQITEHQEWLYKDRAVLPVLKEEFDDCIDTVKLPENE